MYPTLFRPEPETEPRRERIETPDQDFLDIDWHECSSGNAHRLAVVSHGLEGNSRKKYPLGMARELTRRGWDVICLNFRGCSGEPNRLPRLYHSGVTDDLHTVLCHGLATGRYAEAALVGFSMGGNQTLKYLGENPDKVPSQVKCAAVFSVPCDLAGSCRVMSRTINRVYMEYFMKGLREKVRIKANMFPELVNTDGLDRIKAFAPFDDRYTAPLHGFRDAADYYEKCSSLRVLDSIRIPTLLVQARNDPFLSRSCYPEQQAGTSPFLFLEMPKYGGHVGFMPLNRGETYWSETRAANFLESRS